MFLPERTMYGLKVQEDMAVNGYLHTRVFRVALPSHLPDICPRMSELISRVFKEELQASSTTKEGWAILPAFKTTKRVVTVANALAFFGSELASNTEFLDAALAYPEDVFRAAEVLRATPSLFHPILAPLMMRGYKASKTMVKHLNLVVEKRLRASTTNNSAGDWICESPSMDCIQFFIDAKDRTIKWTAEKIVQVLLGTWFAAVHQPALSLVYILRDLCDHPEYLEPLRMEVLTASRDGGVSSNVVDNLPLLDAFVKESCRMHPSDSISIRRKALAEHNFSDGTRILPGDVACVALQAMLLDESVYPQAQEFNPSRFLKDLNGLSANSKGLSVASTTRFADADLTYPLWGIGRHSW